MRAEINEDNLKALSIGGLISDCSIPGFMARRLESGLITFALKYPAPASGRQRWLTLGNDRDITSREARNRARRERAKVELGADPQRDRDLSKKQSRSATVNAAFDLFLERYVYARRLRSAKEIARCLDKYVRPSLGELPIRELRRGDIVALLDTISDKHGPVMSDRVLSHMRKACTWYAVRDDQFNIPIVRGMARSSPRSRARERILNDAEIRTVWSLTEDEFRLEFNVIVRLLLLTAQRRSEVANMRWNDIQGDTWIIPQEFSKNGLSHAVYLTPLAADLLQKIPRKIGPYVFGRLGQSGYGGFSKSKRRLEGELAMVVEASVVPWTLHDLRRTACSLMARAGVRAEVSERVLNHAVPGVRHVYDRYNYSEEKKKALEALAQQVLQIID